MAPGRGIEALTRSTCLIAIMGGCLSTNGAAEAAAQSAHLQGNASAPPYDSCGDPRADRRAPRRGGPAAARQHSDEGASRAGALAKVGGLRRLGELGVTLEKWDGPLATRGAA